MTNTSTNETSAFSYDSHLETVIALISYMSTMSNLSRTPSMIARTLGMEPDKVLYVLENAKALFRKSRQTSSGSGEHFYTLHIRYGLRSQSDSDDGTEAAREPLTPDQISPLLDFAVRVAEQERTESQVMKTLKQTRLNAENAQKWSMFTALIAAVAGIAGAAL